MPLTLCLLQGVWACSGDWILPEPSSIIKNPITSPKIYYNLNKTYKKNINDQTYLLIVFLAHQYNSSYKFISLSFLDGCVSISHSKKVEMETKCI